MRFSASRIADVAQAIYPRGLCTSMSILKREALRICGEFSTALDLLLTDVVLPDTDGVEVAAKAVASRPNLRVLFMSGYTEHPVLRLPGFDRGAPFIQKPFPKAMLAAKVREVLQ